MAVQISALNLGTPLVAAGTWRSRTFTIIYSHGGDCRSLLGGFPLSGPAEAVLRRDPGQSCWSAHLWHCVSRRPLDAVSQAVWRTSINWLDANRVGMTFSFLFGPAALAFLATLRRRRTKSRYLNILIGTAAGCRWEFAATASPRSRADFTLPEWARNRCWPPCSPHPPLTWLCWL